MNPVHLCPPNRHNQANADGRRCGYYQLARCSRRRLRADRQPIATRRELSFVDRENVR